MTAIEVGLLLIGVVFLIGSFFVTEKLSQSEIGEIAKLSETELQTLSGNWRLPVPRFPIWWMIRWICL